MLFGVAFPLWWSALSLLLSVLCAHFDSHGYDRVWCYFCCNTAGFHEDVSLNLLSLYSGDLSNRVLSYAHALELCKLDALDKQFRGLLLISEGKLVNERFGMNNNKTGGRIGILLLRKPICIHINTAPGHSTCITRVCSVVQLIICSLPSRMMMGTRMAYKQKIRAGPEK